MPLLPALVSPRTARHLGVALLLVGTVASARIPLPRSSPNASVTQRIGATDVTVTYCSPAVRNREVFGKLVPFDKVWRTGANEATRIELSTDAVFAGTKVPKGKYALFTIPKKDGKWTVILNSKWDQWGAYDYDVKLDVARFEVKVSEAAPRERLSFAFANTTTAASALVMEWSTTRLAIPIAVDTPTHVARAIEGAAKTWKDHMRAAEYLLDQTNFYDQALRHIDKASAEIDTWYLHWLAARAFEGKKDKSNARKRAKKALEMGEQAKNFNDNDKKQIRDALRRWK